MKERRSLATFASHEQELAALRRANLSLQRDLAAAKRRSEDLVEACYRGARDAYLMAPRTELPGPKPDKRKHKAEAALWHLTDWQGGKRTPTYNSEVMRGRVRTFWERARKITDIQRADHPVKLGVVCFGGDMIEGLFNFPRQVFEIDSTIFAQWSVVSQLAVDSVEAALAIYEEVWVVDEWGNHGRMGSKRDAIPAADNIDRMVYEHARRILAGRARLKWAETSEEGTRRIEIGNYRALLVHGDEAGRNGYVSAQTMIQHVNRWRAGAYPWPFRDVYVGHYHRHAEEPLANGEGTIFWTGSTESSNHYAREQLAADSVPSQRLHFIDPEKGRVTAQYRIYL